MKAAKPSIISRAADALARSPQAFLAGLLIACVVEVAVDWNTTLYEINVARRALRQKGENYADVLRKAAQGAVAARDGGALSSLSEKLFDDGDVVYVRFSDARASVLRDTLRKDFGEALARQKGVPFREHYRSLMERDTRGMLADPEGLRQRMERSRHRDLYQIFTDAQERMLRRFLPAEPAQIAGPPRVLYQDRLSDPGRRGLDRSLTYALGTIMDSGGAPLGVVLVAFRTERLSREILAKLLKGLGVAVFFVALILAQNIIGRRDKLRLRRLSEALSVLKRSLVLGAADGAGLPGLSLGLCFQQAAEATGMAYALRARPEGGLELLLVAPRDGGVAGAIATISLLELHRRAASAGAAAERLLALLAAYASSPRATALSVLLLDIAPATADSGAVPILLCGATCGLAPPALLANEVLRELPLGPEGAAPLPLLAPLRPFAGALDGPCVLVCDGPSAKEPGSEVATALALALRTGAAAKEDVDDVAATIARQRRQQKKDDVFVLVLLPGDGPPAGP